MILLHHLYNYLQTNLTVPKVNEIVHPTILHDLQEVQNTNNTNNTSNQQETELKEYLNQFKKK